MEEVKQFHYRDQENVCNVSQVDFNHHFKRKPCTYAANPASFSITLQAVVHEQFQSYSWEGPFEPCPVGLIILNVLAATLSRYSRNWKAKARGRPTHLTLPLLESYHPFWPPAFPSLQSKRLAFREGWRTQFIRLEFTCCNWNGQVETDAVSRFNRTAMLTHDPFVIRFRRSSSTIQPKRLGRISAPYRSIHSSCGDSMRLMGRQLKCNN